MTANMCTHCVKLALLVITNPRKQVDKQTDALRIPQFLPIRKVGCHHVIGSRSCCCPLSYMLSSVYVVYLYIFIHIRIFQVSKIMSVRASKSGLSRQCQAKVGRNYYRFIFGCLINETEQRGAFGVYGFHFGAHSQGTL